MARKPAGVTTMRATLWLAPVLLLVQGSAGAAVFETWLEHGLRLTNTGVIELSATATGLATLGTSSSSSSRLSALTLPTGPGPNVTFALPVNPTLAPITAVDPDFRLRPDLQGGGVLGNVSGAVASTAGGLTPNTVPVTGGFTLCLLVLPLPPCVAQLEFALGATRTGEYLGHGVGGVLTLAGTGSIRVSLIGAPYTVKTVSAVQRTGNGTLEVHTARGFAHGPLSLTGSTAATSGVVQLVTASQQVLSGLPPGSPEISGQISRLTLHVIPEPGRLLLLGAGAAGMLWLARRSAGR